MEYGNGGAHQVIAGKAYDYAAGIFPDIFGAGRDRVSFVTYSDWPDVESSGQRGPKLGLVSVIARWSNNRHFYNPANGQNFFRNNYESEYNARERIGTFYKMAVQAYCSGDRERGLNFLGAASHFLTDLASPPHTGDQLTYAQSATRPTTNILPNPVMLLNHRDFEFAAQKEICGGFLDRYTANTHRFDFHTMSPYDMAGVLAARSYQHYGRVGGGRILHPLPWVVAQRRKEVAQIMLPIAVDVTAAMLVRFAQEVSSEESLDLNQSENIRLDGIGGKIYDYGYVRLNMLIIAWAAIAYVVLSMIVIIFIVAMVTRKTP